MKYKIKKKKSAVNMRKLSTKKDKKDNKNKNEKSKNQYKAIRKAIVMKKLLKVYIKYCADSKSAVSPWIKMAITNSIKENSILKKIILEQSTSPPRVLFEPLIAALRTVHYRYLNHLYIWNYPLSYENICTLTFYMGKYFEGIKTIYLIDNILTAESLQRFIKYIPQCTVLSELCLDYNDLSNADCKYLALCLRDNTVLTSLSLSYCNLPKESGIHLGKILATTAVSKLYVNGNNLQGDGIMNMIKTCANQAEFDFNQKLILQEHMPIKPPNTKEPSATKTGKKKKIKKAKKKTIAPPLNPGPWIERLHVADNGFQLQNPGGGTNIIHCMLQIKKLITFSECLKELNLYGNHIGNLGSQMLLESLQTRQLAKLPPLKLRSSYRIRLPNIYVPLLKRSTGNPAVKKVRKVKTKKK